MIREDIVATETRHVTEVRAINRDPLEKMLRMRCLAYLSQVKADLLTDTIFSVQEGKDLLRKELKQRALSAQQLRDYREHLEDLVRQRTSALTRANERLEQEAGERARAQRRWEKAKPGFACCSTPRPSRSTDSTWRAGAPSPTPRASAAWPTRRRINCSARTCTH